MVSKGNKGIVALLTALIATTGFAGNDHPEGLTDAGSLRGSSQWIYKQFPYSLEIIRGRLQVPGPLRGIDREDMFLIYINDPIQFSASTDEKACVVSDEVGHPTVCGSSAFNPQLWLFRLDGATNAKGFLANDDCSTCSPTTAARIVAPADDGGPTVSLCPGLYLLAISQFNNDPISAGGVIFNQLTSTEISGPDGAGGASPHTGWNGAGATDPGAYTIILTGALGCPLGCPAITPAGMAIILVSCVAAGAMIFRRLRRESAESHAKHR